MSDEISALFDMFLYSRGYENKTTKARKCLHKKRFKVIMYLRNKRKNATIKGRTWGK